MNPLRARCVPLVAAILSIALTPRASAYTGDDPVLATGIASCTYSEIKAHIGADKSVKYKVYGNCSGSAVSGEMAYRDGKFQESFVVNGAKIRTAGYCDSDPWATAVNCHDQQVQSSGVIVDQSLYKSPPLTLLSGDSARFHQAFQNASRPNPPGVPVNFAASSSIGGQVKAKWLAPDTSGDRPFLDFLLQARPYKAEGAAWVDLGRIAWHAQPDYQLSVKLPPTSAAIPTWDVRLCATTALAATCTPALLPSGSELVTQAATQKGNSATWAAAAAEQKPTVKSIGRVKSAGPPTAPVPICDAARAARARNSPAAPGLEAQCLASGGSLTPGVPIDAAQLDELAVKGAPIAEADPLALRLRAQQPDELAQRGFDIGMAAAENQTAPGPGKQRIHDALKPEEQAGYAAAVAFSLERNRNAELAAKGAAIDAADPTVAETRDADPDVFYQLGFDIATAIFGDAALGAQGNTATGPGSLKIRDALSAAGQRGFNAAVEFHLARQYQ